MRPQTLYMLAFIILSVVIFLSWIYSRYLVTYSHEYSSWRYNFVGHSCGGATLEFSEKRGQPVFFTFFFEDITLRGDYSSNCLISEFDPFSKLFWYDKEVYVIRSVAKGDPLDMKYDRIRKKCVIQVCKNNISIIHNGRVIECNNVGIVVDKKIPTRVYVAKDNTIRIETDVPVQSCPCPTIVRSPENEDSEAKTDLKSHEDGDSVEAKSE